MKILLPLLFALPLTAFGQATDQTFRVDMGGDMDKKIPYKYRFLNPEFREGTVFFRNRTTSTAKLNYSLLHSELMFVGPSKDTLLLSDNNSVTRVTIGDQLFYYLPKSGHIQVIAANDRLQLGRRLDIASMGREKATAYGGYSSSSSIATYATLSAEGGKIQKLEGNDRLILRPRARFYWIDKNQRFYPAMLPALKKLYPDHKAEISRFVQERQINLENEADLEKLMVFLGELQNGR